MRESPSAASDSSGENAQVRPARSRRVRDVTIEAPDGFTLGARVFEPSGVPRSLVVIAPATAVPQSFYRAFAARVAERGHVALTFDYRGIGESRHGSLRRFDARMRDWGAKDLDGVLAWAARERPDLPRALVGHSAGGQIPCLTPRSAELAALVLVAAQSGWWKHWSGASRARRAIEFHALLPGFALALGFVPGWTGIGEDLPGGVAREWTRWCRHPDYILRDETEDRRTRFAAIRAPVLSISIEDDAFAPRAAVDALAALYTGARVERRHVDAPGVGHFGFFRSRHAALWEPALAWLETALPAPRAR